MDNGVCNDPPVQIEPADVIIHERYESHKFSSFDIGLIILKEPVKFNRFIKPIELERTYYIKNMAKGINESVIVVGWGKTENETRSSVKHHASIKIVNQNICQDLWNEHGRITKNLFCAGEGDGVDSCKGDSGGPAIKVFNGTEYLVGIIIMGPENCGQKKPGIYLNVNKFTGWISEKIKRWL